MFGEWLSLVEHLVRDQGVGGSNPLSPTIIINDLDRLMTMLNGLGSQKGSQSLAAPPNSGFRQ